MHPNTFLRSLWRAATDDQVFVAMSFDRRFTDRFTKVIQPAIEEEAIEGISLTAFRVDNSKTGDSILTEIANGIAHSRLVLADVSVIDEGRYAETPIRNGNVMYEVGVALAARLPSEVILLRDDNERFLFDLSTIPHVQVDFADTATAITEIRKALGDRIRETRLLDDARVRIATETLTSDEIRILRLLSDLQPDQARDLTFPGLGQLSNPDFRGLSGLLSKGCVRSVAVRHDSNAVFYGLTSFGYALAKAADQHLAKVEIPVSVESQGSTADS